MENLNEAVAASPADARQQRYREIVKRVSPSAEPEQYAYFRVVQENFRPGMRWLDAGCGHTLVPRWMKGAADLERYFLDNASEIVGTDVDPASLAKPSPIRRVHCNLEQITFGDAEFDLVTCNMVVEHLEDPRKVFREFARVLKPGGVAIIHTPNVLHYLNLISRVTPHSFHVLVQEKLGREEEDVFPTLYRSNTPGKIGGDLCAAGFSQVEVKTFPGRVIPISSTPLLYLQAMLHRAWSAVPSLREILCAVAKK